MKKRRGKKRSVLLVVVIIIAVLLFLSMCSLFWGYDSFLGNVAYIPVKGVITVDGSSSLLGADFASSENIVAFIEDAAEDPLIEAIVFDINSPGGSAVASDEIAQAIKRANKTTVAVIREVGASGGYWIASSTDYVVANRMSIVGSIGVISSYLEFSRLLDDYNVTYQRLVSGQYKDMGTPFKELTNEEREILQKKLDKIHGFFIDEIAENRGIAHEQVKNMATGEFFLGVEGKEMGLIDELGDLKTAEKYLRDELDLERIDYLYYEAKPTLWEALSQIMSPFFYYMGIGMGETLFETTSTLGINV
ncbi:signal peptide peptidase SppA [Candidatus Woesearchaeota archaeon]|nr:signal peptide peptidase SppA [Candidatus Woesearchaeota archaeon]